MPDVEERGEGDPVEVARENARRKAEAVSRVTSREGPSLRGPQRETTIIAVDTLVTLDGRIYGKPRDEAEARRMLEALSGRTHKVVSGLALKRGVVEVVHDTTDVTFRDLGGLLDWYLAHGEWRERAGAYAIQGRGAAFVTGITGDYLNVVGLPVRALLDRWPGVLDGAR